MDDKGPTNNHSDDSEAGLNAVSTLSEPLRPEAA